LVRTLASAALPVAAAQPAAAAARRPRFSVSERYARRLVCTGRGAQRVCKAVEAGRFKLSIHIPLAESDISAFNGTTPVEVEVEELLLSVTLGEDPTYVPGRPRALITRTGMGPKGDPIAYQTIALKWDQRVMQIRVDTLSPDLAEPLFGWDFIDRLTGRYAETSEAVVTVADTTITFQLNLVGRTTSRIVTRNQEEFEISSTTITARPFSDDWSD
jgi:hypothetical protein